MNARLDGMRRAAPIGAAATLAAAYGASIAAGLTLTRFWEDEAYNLTVPLNLLAGRGYSSAGFLTTGAVDLFDVRISTGPTVLLPVAAALAGGADPVVGARAVMAVFSMGLAVALFFVGRRIAGPWGGLAAAAVPLLLDASRSISPLQGLTDLLGEIPSAMFCALALLVLRRRAVWPGLLLGLAVVTKTLSVLFLPAFLVAVLLVISPEPRWRRALLFLSGAALPSVVFELAKLLALGPSGYLVSSRQWLRFLLTGGQEGFTVPPVEKLAALVTGWHAPWVLAVAVLVLGLVLVVRWARNRPAPDRGSAELAVAVAGVGSLLIWVAWWVLSVKDPLWLRHPAPGLLVGVPVILAFLVRAARAALRSGPVDRAAGTAWALLTVVAVGVGAVFAVTTAIVPRTETLPQQRAAASSVAGFPGSSLLARWGPAISIVVLSGKAMRPPGENSTDTAWVVETLDRTPRGMQLQDERVDDLCSPDRVVLENYTVCVPAGS